jgi:hypothetical protein
VPQRTTRKTEQAEPGSACSGVMLTRGCFTMERSNHPADVAELADALDSGSSAGNGVEVQVLSSAPKKLTSLGQQIAILGPFATRG